MTADLIWRLVAVAAAFAGGAYLTWQWRADQRTALAAEVDACRDVVAERGVRLAQMRRQRDEAAAYADRLAAEAQRWEARAYEAEAATMAVIRRNEQLSTQDRAHRDRLLPVLHGGSDIALDLTDTGGGLVMSVAEWTALLAGDPDAPLPIGPGDGDGGGEVCGWLGEWPVLPARVREAIDA